MWRGIGLALVIAVCLVGVPLGIISARTGRNPPLWLIGGLMATGLCLWFAIVQMMGVWPP